MNHRIILRHTSFLAVAAVLIFAFQNCSNSVGFDGSGSFVSKLEEAELPSGTDPVAVNPPDEGDDEDTDIDYDHEGRKIAFSCTTGVKFGWDRAQLERARDLELRNRFGLLFKYDRPVRNVDVENVRGSVIIRNALKTERYDNVRGLVSYVRSLEVDKATNIDAGISSTASIKLGELRDVKAGYICASGHEIGQIRDLNGLYIKLRGRPAPLSGPTSPSQQPKATAREISNIRAAFASLYEIDVENVSDVNGELIVRNSNIRKLENFQGGLTLINSRVRELRNLQGVIRTKNSVIETEINVNARRIELR